MDDESRIAAAIKTTLISPNEVDRNSEAANVVDGLFAIARAIQRLADAASDAYPFSENCDPEDE